MATKSIRSKNKKKYFCSTSTILLHTHIFEKKKTQKQRMRVFSVREFDKNITRYQITAISKRVHSYIRHGILNECNVKHGHCLTDFESHSESIFWINMIGTFARTKPFELFKKVMGIY